ncbi:acyl carrier protein [Lachnotalea glycerini]|uniref:Acyl carrier protein n=1 Tax=Lachnotalea glycerini TaxID=1763509 RepID=A0A255ILD1_9FIRM|nr:acyl carrier protein [Lachnotalea glycerini]PXV95566.1 acyl carrier protein [Lachnotalea glycerini]RDY32880.1 acyl carrier protein [Lachnotalea glycerini]
MNIEKEIKGIISEIVGIAEDKIDTKASFQDDYGLDSLRALEILAAVENKFGIVIDPEKLSEMVNVDNVVRIAKEYINV